MLIFVACIRYHWLAQISASLRSIGLEIITLSPDNLRVGNRSYRMYFQMKFEKVSAARGLQSDSVGRPSAISVFSCHVGCPGSCRKGRRARGSGTNRSCSKPQQMNLQSSFLEKGQSVGLFVHYYHSCTAKGYLRASQLST